MYNGIGLATARGSGTNGYVVKNLSSVRVSSIKQRQNNASFYQDDAMQCATVHRRTSEEILKHQRKRKIEVKVLEYQDSLEESGDHTAEEIQSKVELYRLDMLLAYEKQEQEAKFRQDHEADLKEEENERFRAAFGISREMKEGSAFRFEEQAKHREAEKLQRAEQARQREQEKAERAKIAADAVAARDNTSSASSEPLLLLPESAGSDQYAPPCAEPSKALEPRAAQGALSTDNRPSVLSHARERDVDRRERFRESHYRRHSRSRTRTRSRSPKSRRHHRHRRHSRSRSRSKERSERRAR